MALVILINLVILVGLVYLAVRKGLESALPFFAFMTILVPNESTIPLTGLFGLTAQRFAVVVLILLYFAFGRRGPIDQRKFATPLRFLLILNLIWNIISAINSIDPVMSAKQLISVIFEYYVVYYIFVRTISSPETIQKILKAIVAAMAVTVLFGAVESYTGWSVISWFPEAIYRFTLEGGETGRGFRTHSTFPHAILYGGALAMAIPQTLYLIANAESKFRKFTLWIICLLMFLCLYKTSSRGPWMAAIFGSLLVFFLTYKQIRKYMLVIAALCVLVMVVRPGVYDTVAGMYEATFDPNHPLGSSYEYRYALIDVAKKALSRSMDRTLWGYGQESFYFLQLTGPFLGKDDHKFESCDSAWIQSMIETGYVGFGIFAMLLGTTVLLTLRNVWRLPEPEKFLCWIFLVNLLQYYFLMASVAIYAWGQNGYMLWFIIAMAMAYPKVVSSKIEEANVPEIMKPKLTISRGYAPVAGLKGLA
jgi:O-Antigen ligase